MTLYKLNETKTVTAILNATMPTDDGGSFYPDKVDEATRNSYGYFTFVDNGQNGTEYQRLLSTDIEEVQGIYTKVYLYEDIALAEMKIIKTREFKTELLANDRPHVALTLEDLTDIFIDGGRDDKDNFKEKHSLMLRLSETTSTIKDASNNYHACTIGDIEQGYLNIVELYDSVITYKWAKETEINECETLDELKLVTWVIYDT